MDGFDRSLLRPYAIAVVVEDKVRNSSKVKVWPMEILPIIDGELDLESIVMKNDGVDATGRPYDVSATTEEWVEAEWIRDESNRVFAPDLRTREKVMLWKYADSEVLFWTPSRREEYLRRGEHLLLAYSALPEEGEDEAKTMDNSYTVEVNTFDGYIQINTVKLRGEPFAYTLLLDTANGTFTIKDDDGQHIFLDSNEEIIQVLNKSTTMLEINKKDINGYAAENWNMVAEENINFTCKNWVVNASESVSFTTELFTLTSPESEITGNVKIGGKLEVGDDVTLKSKLGVSGTSSFDDAMTAKGITSSLPIKGPSSTI